ncbi:MAG TPA: LysM domain-containing protein [Pyrinomonadaceae bacterium]|nr:LysM domain-containing protein [Pyrinomonadaceae bacterium]
MRSVTPYERFGESSPEPDAYLEEYVFRAGDTLSGVAHRYYQDWRQWRAIADKNSIVDVRQIPIGTTLLIPPRQLESGRYEST